MRSYPRQRRRDGSERQNTGRLQWIAWSNGLNWVAVAAQNHNRRRVGRTPGALALCCDGWAQPEPAAEPEGHRVAPIDLRTSEGVLYSSVMTGTGLPARSCTPHWTLPAPPGGPLQQHRRSACPHAGIPSGRQLAAARVTCADECLPRHGQALLRINSRPAHCRSALMPLVPAGGTHRIACKSRPWPR